MNTDFDQHLSINGSIEDLPEILDFAVRYTGEHNNPRPFAFRIEHGAYLIAADTEPEDGFTEFPFQYDPNILGKIVGQWLKTQHIRCNPDEIPGFALYTPDELPERYWDERESAELAMFAVVPAKLVIGQ